MIVLRAQKELGVVLSPRKKSKMMFLVLVFSELQNSFLSRIVDCPYYKIQDIPYLSMRLRIVNSRTFSGPLALSNLFKLNKRHRK